MNEHTLAWDDLRFVLAVARGGSLAAASRSLGVSHPTVFRRLRTIERRLGVRLFERNRDGYRATPAGEEAAQLAIRLESEVEALQLRLAGRDLRPAGTLRITTTDTLLLGPLPPLLAAFRRQEPGILLDVGADNAMLDLTRREADVALRPTPAPPETLVGRRVADLASAIYRSRSAPDPGTLEAAGWVVPDDSLSNLPSARWLRERGHDRHATIRAGSLLALRDMAACGLGLAVLPCYVGDPHPGLARVGGPVAELCGALWLLTHPELRRVARVRAFLDGMAGLLAPLRPLFEGARPGGA